MSESDLARLTPGLRKQTAAPGQQFCGDIDMRIARDGTWFYHGSPIGRKPLVKLFADVLTRDSRGEFWLETPMEMARIQVDDAPFTAIEMFVEGEGAGRSLAFRTNVDYIVLLDADHPLRVSFDVETGEPAPYLLVRNGLEALITRSVFYDLVELADEVAGADGPLLGVWSGGRFFTLGQTEEG